ncbi:uncharacterized protein PV07_09955 [Cladophialophora immunda]|uniref:Kelch repeat protein n=1 Tax=Cladophialophora immunda TaxID=569365 RepID=A0A0D2AH72_9EURO|nr:uncharacterized protein PV07_09955 [Cladophialophora immunda]KIW24227.1 hypothetical protein PV07_09955 [Cladophialophora immunda]OQV07584.1 hypothetical protein CLAIMM_11995 isoform 2 [Cladophialophora immunda]
MDTIRGSMSHRFMLLGLLALTQLDIARAGVSLDPVKNFCRRIGHSSVYKNGTLYINGGLETYVDFGADGQQDLSTITSGINENLISVDMTASWDWKTNVSISQNARHESGSVSGMQWPVNVHDGSLFGGMDSSTTLYMFGGTTSSFNQSFPYFEIPPTTQYGLWTYDMDADVWAAVDTSGFLDTIPSWGANAEAPDQGLAFYVGGQIDSGTANTTQFLGEDTVGVGGMVILDTTSNNMKNVTVDDSVKSNRQGAGMVYVDNFGDAGVLVLLGGETQADGLLPMDEIWVFDVSSADLSDNPSSGKNMWYQQTATGDVPTTGRTDFCLVAAPAQDNSSSSIYLYGGTSNGTIFDDVYVLSLPSFTWVKVYTGQDARWSVTCHFIPPRQMITVGGGGKSSNISSDCDWEQKSLAVLDLSTIGWSSVFDAAAPLYDVPDDVVTAIGGGPAGNATKSQPDGGWAESGLSELFTIRKTATTTPAPKSSTTVTLSPTPTPTEVQDNKSSGLSGGAIAGIAIAAVAGVAIVCGAIFFWLRSRRQHRQNVGMEIPEKDSLPSYSTAASQNTPELGGTPQAAEMPAKISPGPPNPAVQEPVEKDAGTVQGPHPSLRQNGPAEME